MSIEIDNLATLQKYFSGVVARSKHHALDVAEVVYSLLGLVVLHHAPDKLIEVKGHDGSAGNILWFYRGENRYALAFNHIKLCIEIREKSTHGKAKYSITNTTSIEELEQIFESL